MESSRMGAPRTTDRAEAQRNRILDAAEKAFINHGFHAAGMALIAAEAEMSPGLIYRYYAGKQDIILAIIERQLEDARTAICRLYSSTDMVQAMFDCYVNWRRADPGAMNAALFAETGAEATRNAALARAVAASDAATHAGLQRWMETPREQGGCGMAPTDADQGALALHCFMNGLAIQAIRQPDGDPDEIRAVIAGFVRGVLPALG